MKKYFVIALALVMIFMLCACGSKSEVKAEQAAESSPEVVEADAIDDAVSSAEPTAAPTATPELVYVENGKIVSQEEALAAEKQEENSEYTFEGTVNTIGASSMTVTSDNISVVFELVDGTILPSTLSPGDIVKVIYVKAANGNYNAKEITVSEEKEMPVAATVIGCVTEAENDHFGLFVDGKYYSFAINKDTKVNASYFDTGYYLRVTYEGVLSGQMTAKEIDVIQDVGGNIKTGASAPVYNSAPVNSADNIIIVTPKPYNNNSNNNYIKPVENPMKNARAQVVSVGDGVAVIRISGSSNDSWMTVASNALPAGTSLNPGDNISIQYNSGTETITQVYK